MNSVLQLKRLPTAQCRQWRGHRVVAACLLAAVWLGTSCSAVAQGRYTKVWEHYGPRFGASFEAGEGVGWSRNFGAAEAFLPVIGAPGNSLVFSELRWFSSEVNESGVNAGLGFRRRFDSFDRTVGLLLHYDYRQQGPYAFDQIGLGLEVLGPWDFRANAYLPTFFSDTDFIASQFVGYQLLIDQGAAALSGFDTEVAKEFSDFVWSPTIAAGVYHYDAQNISSFSIPSATGFKSRLSLNPDDCCELESMLQSDAAFDTTFSFRLTFRFGPGRSSRRFTSRGTRESAHDRLADPVRRQVNVAVVEKPGEVAVDPSTGQPLQFLHAAVSSIPGDGSFERPYSTLDQLLADPKFSAGGIIAYVRGQNTPVANLQIPQYSGNVVLSPNTQLLSFVPKQFVTTQNGLRQLPFSGTSDGLMPSIVGDITLANDVKLSGWDIQGTVLGNSISNYAIEDNNINVITLVSPVISLSGVSGAGSIARNRFGGTISVAGTSYQGDIVDNVGTTAINVNVNTIVGNISRNKRSETTGGIGPPVADELSLSVTADSFSGAIAGNQLNSGSGMSLLVTDFTGSIVDNQITSSTIDGLSGSFGNFSGTIGRNTANQNAGIGLNIFASNFSGTIFDNVASSNSFEGMRLQFAGAGTSTVGVTGNAFSNNNFIGGETEFEASNSGTGSVQLSLSGNSSNTLPFVGFNFDFLNTAGGVFSLGPTGVNGVNVGTVGSSDGSVVIP